MNILRQCCTLCFPTGKVGDESSDDETFLSETGALSEKERKALSERRRSSKLSKHSQDSMSRRREIKILLLGTGESGKSTFVKQVKIIHQNGYTLVELLAYKKEIFRNIIEGMQQMLSAMKRLNIEFQTEASISASETLSLANPDDISVEFPVELAKSITFLWDESGLKMLYDKIAQINYVLDSAPYFFDNLERISKPDYTPSIQDVLKARIKTTGISETRFKMGSTPVCLVDVGGQISERKKWIHCFENVTSIIFCVALSEYDQVLLEDPSQSRMLDSFLLFNSIINSQWFHNTSIILFLNKIDIFKKKLVTSPLNRYFEDYKGGADFEAGAAYLKAKFLSFNYSKLNIYPHYTCATDTQQIETVLAAVRETILSKALKDTGIL
jgi:guanine nucleotide-binding protein G(i) subunit alpha